MQGCNLEETIDDNVAPCTVVDGEAESCCAGQAGSSPGIALQLFRRGITAVGGCSRHVCSSKSAQERRLAAGLCVMGAAGNSV